MSTYRRFKTSKWSLSIILIAVALVAWGVLGLTGTPLAKKGGQPTFSVSLELTGTDSKWDPVESTVYDDGEATWPHLDVHFWDADDLIQVGGVNLDLIQMTCSRKHGDIVWAMLHFRSAEGTYYRTPKIDVGQPIPEIGGSFTVYIGKSGIDVVQPNGKGRGAVIGTVGIGDAVYTRTN